MQSKAFSMEDLFAFLNAGVSAFHSTAAAAAILEAEGYRNCPESAAWHLVPGGKYYTTRNGSAILAWRMPKGPLTGWHAAASHSDSPTWRIKTLDGAGHGFARAEVEGYGGMLMSTWFDRPLSVAGRLLVRTADGVESRLVHPDRALACIPNLCIHFNREANTGLNYNPQVDLQPIFGAEGGSLKDTLAAEAGGKAEDILATDLVLCITEKAQRVGLQGEYFMSGRIDDLECAYATLYGFLQGRGEEAGRGDIWVMFDNEEVGSSSRQGAQGSLMSDVLARIEESLGVTKEQSIRARTNCPAFLDGRNCIADGSEKIALVLFLIPSGFVHELLKEGCIAQILGGNGSRYLGGIRNSHRSVEVFSDILFVLQPLAELRKRIELIQRKLDFRARLLRGFGDNDACVDFLDFHNILLFVLVSSEKNPADNRNVFVLGGRFVFCVVDNHSQHGLSEPENIICTNVVVACFFVQKPILVKLSKGDDFLLSFDELILWHRVRRRNFLKYDFSGIFSCENIG